MVDKKCPFSVVHSVFHQYAAYCILTERHRLSGTLEVRLKVRTYMWYYVVQVVSVQECYYVPTFHGTCIARKT